MLSPGAKEILLGGRRSCDSSLLADSQKALVFLCRQRAFVIVMEPLPIRGEEVLGGRGNRGREWTARRVEACVHVA